MRIHFAFLLTAVLLLSAGCRTLKCPQESFADVPCPHAPDYSDPASWAAHPDQVDRADSVPVTQFSNEQAHAEVDVFFIHPTTFFNKKEWNADLDDRKLNKQTDATTIRHQASIFNGIGRVYAPRYRQMTFGGFRAGPEVKKDADQAYDLAYQDVKSAFSYYLEHENDNRPFVIASHSQGAGHAIRLIREEIEQTELLERMVVAYVVGWPVKKDTFDVLQPCESPEATGCFATWCTMEWGHEPENPLFFKDAIVVNPITWRMDTTASLIDDHRGVVMANYHKYFPQKLQAKIHGEVLWATRPKVPGTWVIGGHNFHIADYNLFWGNVRENVAVRVREYLEGK